MFNFHFIFTLDQTDNWTKLSRAELTEEESIEPKLNRPEVSLANGAIF